MQVMTTGYLMVMMTGGQIKVILVEMVRIGTTVVESRIVDVHQGVDGESVISSHLNGTWVVTVKQTVDWD